MQKTAIDKTIIDESFADIAQDCKELEYLFSSIQKNLNQFIRDIKTTRQHIPPEVYSVVSKQAENYKQTIETKNAAIKTLQKKVQTFRKSEKNIILLSAEKNELYTMLRTYHGLIAGLITSTDWQSPSFLHALQSMAGRQTGKITGNFNDYKRDQHLDEQIYEQLFKKEYIDVWLKNAVHVYMTNSGMAAFTTIIMFLLMEGKITKKVLVGKAIYFENREILKKLLPKQVIEVDEEDIQTIETLLQKNEFSAVIFDSLCNNYRLPIPNLRKIISLLIKYTKNDLYLVIDNIGLTITYQPFKQLFGKVKHIHPIFFESLNKYHQFGMDRVTGGIIYTYGKDTYKLFDVREHIGTNIADTSVYALPLPNRKMLEKRLQRFERNALTISNALATYTAMKQTKKITAILYPGLKNHPSYSWMKHMSFHGSFFTIIFADKYDSTRYYKAFVTLVMQEARRKQINVVSGTSFGLNTTRVYLTSARSDFGKPFVRVSVGTENRLEIEQLIDVFQKAIDKFEKRLLPIL